MLPLHMYHLKTLPLQIPSPSLPPPLHNSISTTLLFPQPSYSVFIYEYGKITNSVTANPCQIRFRYSVFFSSIMRSSGKKDFGGEWEVSVTTAKEEVCGTKGKKKRKKKTSCLQFLSFGKTCVIFSLFVWGNASLTDSFFVSLTILEQLKKSLVWCVVKTPPTIHARLGMMSLRYHHEFLSLRIVLWIEWKIRWRMFLVGILIRMRSDGQNIASSSHKICHSQGKK